MSYFILPDDDYNSALAESTAALELAQQVRANSSSNREYRQTMRDIRKAQKVIGESSSTGLTRQDYVDIQNMANAAQAAEAQKNRDFQQTSAREAMQFEADQAKLNRDFQLEMSNTAYQRATADLRAAGLNPMLAYSQGGASTSSGSTASGYAAGGSQAALDSDQVASLLSAQMSQSAKNSSATISALGAIASAALLILSKGKAKV